MKSSENLREHPKLAVLIGNDTHKNEWVEWEINAFYSRKEKVSGKNTWKRIRGMSRTAEMI
jgi:hypothetical protein